METCSTSGKLTLLSFLLGLSGVWADIQMPQTSMEVVQGKLVQLMALYVGNPNTDLTTSTIIWNFVTDNTQQVISYTKGTINEGSPQFRGRVGFLKNMPSSDVSLYINNTKESDTGRYVCQVIIPSVNSNPAEVSLVVNVPPAVPKCSVSGKPVLKGNVTLMCTSSAGKPVPLYKWRRSSPTSEVFFAPMLNENTGNLKLSNLSSNMSGTYVCTASNTAGSETCSVTLDIINTNKVGMIVGATVGSVLGFIFLLCVCVGFLLIFKRRRDNEDDMANEIKEDAQAPKRVSWAKSGMGSDVISKNGTLSSIASSPRHKDNHHHHHHHLQQYPQHPASDTASIITATGSATGYRPPRQQGASTPTHYSYNNSSTLPHGQPASAQAANGSSQAVQERYGHLPQAQQLPQTYAQLQGQLQLPAPSPPPLPTSTITASNIHRMGGVPIMVPAQNQAGSLV